jgi:glycosyltransferase involved in cell wall biosynthesis
VITNSDLESDSLASVLALPHEKFATVYNGIDECFLNDATPALFRDRFGLQGRFVLNVGNIEPRKNQLTLVRAMKGLPDVKLVLVGQKRDPAYAEQVLQEGGEQVIYLGALPHGDLLLSGYAACDLFCLPSTLETPGLAALEASAQGAPLLVTSEGSCAEYFGDRAAYVLPDSAAGLQAAIGAMLQCGNGRAAAAASAFRREAFTWSSTTEALRHIYQQLA